MKTNTPVIQYNAKFVMIFIILINLLLRVYSIHAIAQMVLPAIVVPHITVMNVVLVMMALQDILSEALLPALKYLVIRTLTIV